VRAGARAQCAQRKTTPDINRPATAPTDRIAAMSIYDDIELFGLLGEDYTPPIADHDAIAGEAGLAAEAVMQALTDCGLERFARAIGWGVVNAVHREIDRIEKRADDNAAVIRDLVATQDGSEVRDVELQDAMLLQDRMAECREALVAFREAAADAYAAAVGEPWLPRSGSRTGPGVTAAQIDARAMLKAQREQRAAELTPDGPRFVVAGHKNWTDVDAIYAALDKLRARQPDMVLVTKGGPGVELIARKWAAARDVPQIIVKMDWSLASRAAFEAIERQIKLKPAGVVTFETEAMILNGPCMNLLQNAKRRRIKIWRVGAPKSRPGETVAA
jgi:hypothetical protein